ncbi:MAG: hypothetical protein KAG97_04100, partial [Victivallales bacterium]|nr:hypothetical protein [Victivallales bacterium]
GEQLMEYDKLYDLIKADPLLVKAVSKHVSWVKSSNDIIKLLDMYLVQNVAKKIMRYQYFTFPDCLVKAAITLGDKDVTNDWMKFAFTKSFRYGCPPQGFDVLLDNLADRSGLAYKGSTFYSLGEAECIAADILETYSEVTDTEKYKMYNKYHPHTIDGCHTPILLNYAGFEFPRIGDVTGPDKAPGVLLRNSYHNFKLGWEYTKNPIFAPIIKHLVGSKRVFRQGG